MACLRCSFGLLGHQLKSVKQRKLVSKSLAELHVSNFVHSALPFTGPEDVQIDPVSARFQDACNKIASEAIRNGSSDNVTVMLVSITKQWTHPVTHLLSCVGMEACQFFFVALPYRNVRSTRKTRRDKPGSRYTRRDGIALLQVYAFNAISNLSRIVSRQLRD